MQWLLRFLKKVVEHEANKMNLTNVSMIMAPNLFLAPSNRGRHKVDKDIEIRMAAGTANIVRMLIRYQEILWTVCTSHTLYLIIVTYCISRNCDILYITYCISRNQSVTVPIWVTLTRLSKQVTLNVRFTRFGNFRLN